MSTMIMHEMTRARQRAAFTPEQTERAAELMCRLLRREITLAQYLDALPGQLPMERAA